MAIPSQEQSFILVRRQPDGTIQWLPVEGQNRLPVENGESYTLIDRADYEAPDSLVAERQGVDLVLSTGGNRVLTLAGFFVAEAVAFHPTTDIASSAGPFTGSPLTESSAAQENGVLFASEPAAGEAAPVGAGSSGGGVSPMLWGGLAAGLGLAAAAAGGGGGGGSSGSGNSSSTAAASPPSEDSSPEITSGGTAGTIDENSGSGQVVYRASASEAVTWSLGGTDADAFSIDPDSGEVVLSANPDFESQSSYSFDVVATDSNGNRSDQTVALTIADLDDTPPIITSADTATVDENAASGTTVYTATADDVSPVTWSLAASGDASVFSIDPDTGQVTINERPDFETTSSYAITLIATDAAGNRSEQTVTLAVNDLDETAPVIRSIELTLAEGAENGLLGVGDTVTVAVSLSEVVTVDTTGGIPRVLLNVGGEEVPAEYLSGSGTATLLFQYTIAPGDQDGNGISIRRDSVETNGGAITDQNGNAAELDHGRVAGNADFRVDAIAPLITDSEPEDDESDVDTDDDIRISFSENVRAGSGSIVLSNGSDSRTISVNDTDQISFSGNEITIDPSDDLQPGTTYRVGIDAEAVVDSAGNPFAGVSVDDDDAISFSTETEADTSIVIFDLISGDSSDHSDRTFDSNESYEIYILVPSNESDLRLSASERWDGAENLGSDDRVILVGDAGAVRGAFFAVNRVSIGTSAIAWQTLFGFDAAILQGRSLTRATGFDNNDTDDVRLFDSEPPDSFFQGHNGQLSTMYLTSLPPGLLTSQGLV